MAFCLVCTTMLLACCASPENAKAPIFQTNYTLFDQNALPHNLANTQPGTIRVFVFLSTQCPIANANIPTLNSFNQQFVNPPPKTNHKKTPEENTHTQKVQLFAVIADPYITRKESADHYREFKASFPVLFDSSCQLRDMLKPTHVPEAFVFDPQGRLAYRGAIDNAWAEVGKRRPVITRHYLVEAVTSLLNNQPPPIDKSQPVGCPVEYPAANQTPAPITYRRDIAPILQTRCTLCHQPAATAFPLNSITQATANANRMATTPCKGPPHPARQPTPRETELLKIWANSATPQGDTADWPPAP